MGKHPCNCLTKFKVKANGVWAYGGDDSCRTSGTVYKTSCLSNGCKCFYIGKSQCYVKTHIQEHIGEVTKLYAKNIVATNRSQMTTPPSRPSQTQSEARSTSSLAIQEETSSLDSVEGTAPLCVVINNTATNTPPPGTDMQLQNWMSPDMGPTNNSTIKGSLPTMTYGLPANTNLTAEAKIATCQWTTKQDNCSTLACHLYSQARHLHFRTWANVATWCQSNIKIKIIWQSNPIAVQKTASTRFWCSGVVERIIIGHNFTSASRTRKIYKSQKQNERYICSVRRGS